MGGMHEAMLQAHRDELQEASMAREEAEAHARMLQASISRYDRLKKEVESFSADPSAMQRVTQPPPSQKETGSGDGGDGETHEIEGVGEIGSALGAQNGTWGVSSEETSWGEAGNVAWDGSGSAKEGGMEEDLGEQVGIPKQGWQPPKRTPGQDIMDMLRAAPSSVVATVASTVSAVAGTALMSSNQPAAAAEEPAQVSTQIEDAAIEDAAETARAIAQPQRSQAAAQAEVEEDDGMRALDREIEMELEAKLQAFRQEMDAARQAEIREAQRKDRARQKAAAKKEQDENQKKIQQSLYESDEEQEVGKGDPNYVDWMNVSDDEGAKHHQVRSRSKSRGRADRRGASDRTQEGGGSARKAKAPAAIATTTPRGRRSKSRNTRDKKEPEEDGVPAVQHTISTPEKAKGRHGDDHAGGKSGKKGKARRRLGAGKGGGVSDGDSDGEGLGSRDPSDLAAAAKQAATAMSRRKEVARKRGRAMWYGVLMFIAVAVIGWMLWASVYTPVPLKSSRKGPKIASPVGGPGFPGGMPGRAPTGPPPAPKGKKEITRVMINNAESGIQIPMILYHSDPAGIESDVDRFIKHFRIPAEQYRDQLLQAAFSHLEAMSGGAASSRAAPRNMQPMGHAPHTQHGNGFGDVDDLDDDDDDEEEEWDAEDQGQPEKAEEEEEEEEEWDPDAHPEVHSQQRRTPAPSPPAPKPKAETSHVEEDGEEEWAEEDEEHEMLPKSPKAKPVRVRDPTTDSVSWSTACLRA